MIKKNAEFRIFFLVEGIDTKPIMKGKKCAYSFTTARY